MLKPDGQIAGSITGLIAVRPDIKDLYDEALAPKLQQFFYSRGVTDAIEIPAEQAFHELDFKGNSQHTIGFFYRTVFGGCVHPRRNRLENTVRYQWTVDGAQCAHTCEATRLKYSVLFVGAVPAAYTILLPLDDLFAYARARLTRSMSDESGISAE